MVVVPKATPVTPAVSAELFTVAIEGFAELQVPGLTVSVKVVTDPPQTVCVPVIAFAALTVKLCVAEHVPIA